jgi:hypothetical protein
MGFDWLECIRTVATVVAAGAGVFSARLVWREHRGRQDHSKQLGVSLTPLFIATD